MFEIEEPQDIVAAAKSKDSLLEGLRQRVEDDFELFTLKTYERGAGYESYTTNRPRTLALKCNTQLADAKLLISFPVVNEIEEEREAMAAGERLLYGALKLNDDRLTTTGQPVLQGQMAFYANLRGWLMPHVYVYKNEEGETVIDIRMWDILNTSWEVAGNQLAWECHESWESRKYLEQVFGVEVPKTLGQTLKFWQDNDMVKVYNWWDAKVNAIVAGGVWLKKPKAHEIGHTPGAIIPVGSTPYIQPKNPKFDDTMKYVGESRYESNRHIYKPMNELFSDIKTIIAQAVHNPMIIWSSGGMKSIPENPYYKGSWLHLNSDTKEDVRPLFTPVVPQDAMRLADIFEQDESRGGMPRGAWGELGFQMAGYLFNLLSRNWIDFLYPPRLAMETAYNWISREVLYQYAKGGFNAIRVVGRNASNIFFDVELASEQIKGDWMPECKIQPKIPEDEANKYVMARIAKEAHLLSDETIAEVLLGIQDTDLEQTKMLEEWALNLPPIKLRRVAAALAERGREDIAAMIMDEVRRMETVSVTGEPAGKRGPEAGPGMPFETGVRPEIAPPEVLGGNQEINRLAAMGLERGV